MSNESLIARVAAQQRKNRERIETELNPFLKEPLSADWIKNAKIIMMLLLLTEESVTRNIYVRKILARMEEAVKEGMFGGEDLKLIKNNIPRQIIE